MRTKQNTNDLLKGEITSKETIDVIFNDLENQLLDKREIIVDLKNVSFISVYFLERLEKFIEKAQELNVHVKINSVNPNVYKVLQIRKNKEILLALI